MSGRHVPALLAVGAFLLTSASGFGCWSLGPDDQCGSDADCAGDAICDVGVGCDAGSRCTFRPTCGSDAECATGEECVVRPAVEASHPFDETIPERGFCERCEDELFCGGSGGGGGGEPGAGGAGGAP